MKRITVFSTIAAIGAICFLIIIFTGENCDECFSAPVMAIKFFICGLVIIAGSAYFAKEFFRIEKIIFNIESYPMMKTDEATEGVPFAGEGVVKSERVLKSPYTDTPCVYFHSIKEMYIESGRGRGKWVIVENISLFVPFYIEDERGRLKVDLSNLDDDFSGYKIPFHVEGVPNPKNSEVDCDALLKRSYVNPKELHKPFSLKGTRYRWSEFVLRPETKVFVYGMVSRRNGELVLHEDERCPLIISKKNRDQYVNEFYQGENLVYFVHLLIALGFTISLLSLNYFLRLNPLQIFPPLLIGNLFITGSVVFSLYNRIVTLKNRALNALSNIEVELKRRADLIPNLVEVVKGYVKHEIEAQKIITEARTKIVFSKELKKEEKSEIPSLVAAIENYPDLKASQNFQNLMRALVDTEERITYSREFYNRTVRKYNTIIKQFPFLIISFPLRLKEMDFLSLSRG